MAYKTGDVSIKTLNNVVIQLRNDTATNWAGSNYVLAQGELGLDLTNNVIKIGNGTDTWTNLPNAGSVIQHASAYDEDTNPGGIDAEHGGIKVNGTDINVYTLLAASTAALGGVKSAADVTAKGSVAVDANGNMTVEYVDFADELKTARNISINENGTYAQGKDVVATGVAFKGNANIDLAAALTETGVTAGSYAKVTVDAKGRITAGLDMYTADITDAVAATTGATDAAKAIKTDAAGELDDSFLKAVTRTDAAADNTATEVITGITSDAKGRITATTKMDAKNASAGSSDAGKLIKADANGLLSDTFLAEPTRTDAAVDNATTTVITSVTSDAKGRVTATGSMNAIASTSKTATDAGKLIKADSAGELDDTFLKNITYAASTADNTATTVLTGLTVDGKGRVSAAGTMEATTTGGTSAASGKLVKLDGNGKLDNTIFPALAIGEVQTVTYADTETVGTDGVTTFKGITTAQSGDVVVVSTTKGTNETQAAYEARCATNGDGVYIYAGNTSGADAYSASNWVLIKTPGAAIQSVNGETGPTVVLDTDKVAEGSTNLYFTEARVYTAIHKISARDANNSFSDAAHIMLDTDSLILQGGNASSGTTNNA